MGKRKTTLILAEPDHRRLLFYCATTDSYIYRWYDGKLPDNPRDFYADGSCSDLVGIRSDDGLAELIEHFSEFYDVDAEFLEWIYQDMDVLPGQAHPLPDSLKQKWRERAVNR